MFSLKSVTLVLLTLFFVSCSKSDSNSPAPPPEEPETPAKDTTFANDAAAITAMASVYTNIVNPQNFTSGSSSSLSILCGLYADELSNYSASANQLAFYQSSLTPFNALIENSIWRPAYDFIDSANRIIEKLAVSNNVSSLTKQYLVGEAKFLRAFCHFYLVNLFGDIPYITTTDTSVIKTASRISKTDVYQKIVIDLKDAAGLLSDYYLDANVMNFTTERIRPNKWAATALLARTYLYMEEWAKAEIEASKVIQQSALYSLEQLNNVFLKNNKEAIWQLKPTAGNINTYEGNAFILTSQPSTNVTLSPSLVSSFSTNDGRKTAWKSFIGLESDPWHYPYKYKIKNGSTILEYSMVLRLGEQYLIRAEARIRQDKFMEGRSDINIIRQRANLTDISFNTKDELLLALENERRLELFTEWGHRWMDLKRTGRSNVVMQTVKTPWFASKNLFPIPVSVITSNIYMVQNPGY